MTLTVVNKGRALAFVDGDEDALVEVVRAFMASVPGDLDNAKNAAQLATGSSLSFSIHKVKSSMSVFCDGFVIAKLTEIETQALAGDLATATANLQRLEPLLHVLIAEVKSLVPTSA